MPKPAVYLDLVTGDYTQFAPGREDVLQTQHVAALDTAAAVNLFTGTTSTVSLGGLGSTTAVTGSTVAISSALSQDISFTARGAGITLNQLGNEALSGFAPAVTSIVAALNDVKAAVGFAGLQGAYDIVNTIAMTSGRDLQVSTFDGVGPANFVLQNGTAQTFLRTDTAVSTVQLGDGTSITSTLSGYVASDINFDSSAQYRRIQREGTPNGTPATPDALYIKGLVNGANSAGADLYLVAERNTAGPAYGGEVWLASYLGPQGTGTLQAELTLSVAGAELNGTSAVSLTASSGAVSVTSSAASDISLSARGGSITVNELGAINLDGAFTATSIVGALNELINSLNLETLQQAYDAGNSISMTTGRPLTITTFDGGGPSNFVLQNASAQPFLRTNTAFDTVYLGDGTNITVDVNGQISSDLRFDQTDNADRTIWLPSTSTTSRTLYIVADKSPDNSHGSDLSLSAVRGPSGDGGSVTITAYDNISTRSFLELHPTGTAAVEGMQLSGYGKSIIGVDPVSPLSSPLTIANTVGPITVDATGGTLTFNATGNAVTLDCTSLDMDATAASHITSSATLLLSAVNDLTFGARGTTITLNQAGDVALDPFFTSTSIIGALNELVGGGGVGTLQQTYNLGNTIAMTATRPVQLTTFDTGGAESNFIVQNTLGRVFLETDTANSSVNVGDTALNDVVFAGRGASLTFNQASDPALVGFSPGTTSIVAALNELMSAPPSGAVTAIYVTAEPITYGDAVYMTAAGTIGVADYTTASLKDSVLGFSMETKNTGLPCTVVLAGEITVKSTLLLADIGKDAFLDATGNVSSTVPGSGYSLTRVGVITASGALTSKIVMQIDPPIAL